MAKAKKRLVHRPFRILHKEPFKRTINFPDPTPEMLETPEFNAIWNVIKSWDIAVPGAYTGYTGAMGNHARIILDALKNHLVFDVILKEDKK